MQACFKTVGASVRRRKNNRRAQETHDLNVSNKVETNPEQSRIATPCRHTRMTHRRILVSVLIE